MPAFECKPLDPNTHQIRPVHLEPRSHEAFEPWNWILFPEKGPVIQSALNISRSVQLLIPSAVLHLGRRKSDQTYFTE